MLIVFALASLAVPAQPASAATAATFAIQTQAVRPAWKVRLDQLTDGRNVSVSVRLGEAPLYQRAANRSRVPASNQKLLVTMALFDSLGPRTRMQTRAAARTVAGGTVRGDLWLIGGGDPSLTAGGPYGRALPFRPARLGRLAARLKAAGITRVRGSVVGAQSYYSRDWWAPGWRWDYPLRYAPLASGLSFDGNTDRGVNIKNPERRAAKALTRKLRARGIAVIGSPRTGRPPRGVSTIAHVRSVPVDRIVRHMNRTSSNYYAEMMGKRLAVAAGRRPGSIAAGADVVRRWAARRGVEISAHDASGLSAANRASAHGLTTLLESGSSPARRRIRASLAGGGRGTLEHRLHGVRVRAKTGTLPGHSALSGYVYLEQRKTWASFSILCTGMPKYSAAQLEDRIVKLIEKRAG